MTDSQSLDSSGHTRRRFLRNGLLAGLGVTAVSAASPALAGSAQAASAQSGWRWCSRCSGLFYGPQQAQSICPGAAHHNLGSNWIYSVPYNEPGGTTDPQPGWFWCTQCKGLFHGGSLTFGGRCPLSPSASHQAGSSFHYSMYYSTSVGQASWAYCQVCAGLFWLQPGYQFYGECPWAAGPHDGTNTYNYDLSYTIG